MKILIISLSNLGDAILTYPALQALWTAYPNAEYHVLAPENARGLFEGDPRFHMVWKWERDASFLLHLILIVRLAGIGFDLAVDFRNSIIPFFLPGVRRTPFLRRTPPRLHRVEQHLSLLERLGIPRVEAPSPLPFSSQEQQRISQWVEEGKRVVVMAPGARSDLKRWDPRRFAAVADRLIQEQGVQVILAGAVSESGIASQVCAAMRKQATDLVGQTTLRELAALLNQTQLVLTNDSACLHAAEMMQVPAVAIFGPTDSKKYGPRHPLSRIIRRELVCAPCEKAQCQYRHECMEWINEREVYDAAAGILNGTP